MLHSKYSPCPYKPCGGHPFKLSAADYVQQLISSQKAGNRAQIAKALVDMKDKPCTLYAIHLNLRQAGLNLCGRRKAISQQMA